MSIRDLVSRYLRRVGISGLAVAIIASGLIGSEALLSHQAANAAQQTIAESCDAAIADADKSLPQLTKALEAAGAAQATAADDVIAAVVAESQSFAAAALFSESSYAGGLVALDQERQNAQRVVEVLKNPTCETRGDAAEILRAINQAGNASRAIIPAAKTLSEDVATFTQKETDRIAAAKAADDERQAAAAAARAAEAEAARIAAEEAAAAEVAAEEAAAAEVAQQQWEAPPASNAAERSAPPAASSDVVWETWTANVGGQDAIDVCTGGLSDITEWSAYYAFGHGRYLGLHNHCGGAPNLSLGMGNIVKIDGVRYSVVGSYVIPRPDGPHFSQSLTYYYTQVANLGGDVNIQTCYWDINQGMRVVALDRV